MRAQARKKRWVVFVAPLAASMRLPRPWDTTRGVEDAKAFVESFHPWDIFVGSADVDFDETVHPIPEETK